MNKGWRTQGTINFVGLLHFSITNTHPSPGKIHTSLPLLKIKQLSILKRLNCRLEGQSVVIDQIRMCSVLHLAFLTCTFYTALIFVYLRLGISLAQKRSLQVLSGFFFQDIPSNGIDKWFKLEGRSSKSRVDGDCHLKITLTTGKVILRERG